jgi:hypothetical protein
LNQRDAKYKRFNCEDIINKKYKIDNNFKLEFDELILVPLYGLEEQNCPNIENQIRLKSLFVKRIRGLFVGLFSTIDAKWLSNPFSIYQATINVPIKVAKACV